jgi:hypothetical protein
MGHQPYMHPLSYCLNNLQSFFAYNAVAEHHGRARLTVLDYARCKPAIEPPLFLAYPACITRSGVMSSFPRMSLVPSLALYHHMRSACLTGGDPLGLGQCSDQVTCNKLIVSHNAGYQVCHGCHYGVQPMFPIITDVPGGEKYSNQVVHNKAIICTACAIRPAVGVPWAQKRKDCNSITS